MEAKLHILIADDESIVHATIGDYLSDIGHRIDSAYDGREALEMIVAHEYDLALIDIKMPKMEGIELLKKVQTIRPELSIVLITGHGTMEMVIQALREGAVDFLTKPIKFLELDAVIEKSIRIHELRKGQRHLRETIRGLQNADNLRFDNRALIGMSQATQQVRAMIKQAVESRVETVLMVGETGTGKEVAAREIHFQSSRGENPFIAVNCPALPESLVESELFGHVKGAFTGATVERAGYFEMANGGTLFLDEIGDLSLPVQAKLLRVLETRSLRRIGGSREIAVKVRIIAATNTPLETLVKEGTFRRDLLYRLNIFPIHIQPLRTRKEDIPPLAEHFLTLYSKRSGKKVSGIKPEAMKLLLHYDYPGKVRELQNILERAAIICRDNAIDTEHIIFQPAAAASRGDEGPKAQSSDDERTIIIKALENAHWNRRKAAASLGMPYSTLRYKMTVLGIS